MLKIIRELLVKIVDNIDYGNSNISAEEAIEVIDMLKRFTDKEVRISKYEACKELNISRATFDNHVKNGKIPKGKHTIGFKELSWSIKDLQDIISKRNK